VNSQPAQKPEVSGEKPVDNQIQPVLNTEPSAKKNTASFFKKPSFWIPVIMLAGISAGLVYYFNQKDTEEEDPGTTPFPQTPIRESVRTLNVPEIP
jgi:hypothetical protein